jgi:long-chain acyl-CoA synthetase
LQGYGLTETSPVIAVNNPAKRQIKLGTVGPVIDDVEVKISKEGEILVKGPNIMHGYYRNEKLTNEVIDKEGWFHTGDVGEMVDNIFLRITDRKKEIFKLSSGKYIAPQVIENKLKESIFIEQVMVIGENQKYASAIVSPNLNYLHNWAYHENLDYRDNEELIMLPHVQSLYKQEINSLNTHLGEHEQIKRIKLVCEEWSPETGELSPTLKLKRDVITEKYQDVIDSIYNLSQEEKGSVIGKLTSQVTKGLKTGIDSLRKRTNQ